MTDPQQAGTLTLNNGVTIPALGLGVFQSPPQATAGAVEAALRTGYRHIDTAAAYFNEREVGEGLRRSGVDRAEVFIETKIWVSDYGYGETLHAFEKSTRKLGVDRLDLLLLHQPVPERFDTTVAAHQALERLYEEGKVRSIGVSTFMPHHLAELVERTSVVPAVNQVELHPYFTQPDVQKANAEHRVLTQAWSPIGGITFYWDKDRTGRSTLQDPTVQAVAQAHGKAAAQVLLRWHIQHGRNAIPKSTSPTRITENFDVFGFELSADELAALDALDTGVRGGPDPNVTSPERFKVVIPEN
ncbi:aldo/keto reductase [Streptomyces fuscichromogenes]|uniref:Oxidoreductase n=1 Tax=Streptomyces fuscichromogenes TaxID=1324013 RepID=A0A918CWK5_9ACTN|nr:aldo/keto reductase [Streptomyces fuscichromogenes]GGN40430.1 oxidoreductase [Streptomyces fuscichromogenes]